MTEFEDYSCFGSTRSPLQPYVSCHECLQQSRFWVPSCDPCLPAVCDHLSWATIFAWPTGWSLYTGFTVHGKHVNKFKKKHISCRTSTILIDFTCLNVQAEYLIQTVLYHFEWYFEISELKNLQMLLTHWGRVTHICVSKITHHWFR